MLFSRFVDGGDLTAYLSLVGDAERDAAVTVTLSRPDGSTVAKREGTVQALKRSSSRIRDLVPIPDAFPQGFITVQSTIPIYGVELFYNDNVTIMSNVAGGHTGADGRRSVRRDRARRGDPGRGR